MARTLNERSDVLPLVAEVFREFGYEGATFSRISDRTGLGKGSLYHFFPKGKEAMGAAILAEISDWFEQRIFAPLDQGDPVQAIDEMWSAISDYFRSGERICLVGAFALDATRDRFSADIAQYFQHWIDSLAAALARAGVSQAEARHRAEDAVLAIQGALVLSRAIGDESLFGRACSRAALRILPPRLKGNVA